MEQKAEVTQGFPYGGTCGTTPAPGQMGEEDLTSKGKLKLEAASVMSCVSWTIRDPWHEHHLGKRGAGGRARRGRQGKSAMPDGLSGVGAEEQLAGLTVPELRAMAKVRATPAP